MSKERLINLGWTVGAVVVGLTIFKMFVAPHLPLSTPSVTS